MIYQYNNNHSCGEENPVVLNRPASNHNNVNPIDNVSNYSDMDEMYYSDCDPSLNYILYNHMNISNISNDCDI